MLRYVLVMTALLLALNGNAAKLKRSSGFPVRGEMRTRVDFWKKVYTQISTREAFVHDSQDLSVIYGKIKLKSSRRG